MRRCRSAGICEYGTTSSGRMACVRPALLAFDTKNMQDNRALSHLEPSSVISMPNQATGMAAAAVEPIYWKICCDFSVYFWCYPLEACEISCYHDGAMLSNDFCHCWLWEQEPGFARAWVPAFCIERRLVASCHDTMFFCVRKSGNASVYTAAYQAVRECPCS